MKRRTLLLSSVAAATTAALGLGPAWADAEYGKTHKLVMALPYAMTSLDPAEGGNLRGDLSVIASIYSSLTRVTPDGKIEGVAAREWEQKSELVWVFKLRDDVTFADGKKLTAESVKWNVDRINAIEKPSWIVISLKNVEKTTALDELTVEFTLKKPDLNFDRRMAGIFYMDPTWVETHNPTVEAMGSGPYAFVSFNPETGAELEANPNYFGKPPAFSKVNFRVITDEAARINSLKAGEIDTAALISPQDMTQLEDDPNLKIGIIPSTRVQIIRFNTLVKPMDDVRVRQAINYAIDKEAITKALFRGLVKPANSQMITPLHRGYNTDMKPWPYDPDKARALLKEAGYPDGFDVEMVYGKGTYVGAEQAAQVVVAMLGQVGIRAKLNIIPASVSTKRSGSDEQAAMTWFGYADTSTIAADTMSYIASGFLHTRGPIPPALDEALAEAKSATTVDAEVAAMKKATQAAADDALAVFLWDLPQSFAYNSKVVWHIRSDDWTLPYDVVPA